MNTEPAASARGPVRGKILVIDDNPIIQRAVYFALRDKGYKVLMAGEILDAINIIREEQPSLILLDLSFPPDAMNIGGPLQDGFFFIDWVRRTPEVEKIPIMIISGSEPDTYKDRVAAAGIKVFFHKPLDKEALVAAIEEAIGEKTAGS
jgi:CheY-like chemotaxis protein